MNAKLMISTILAGALLLSAQDVATGVKKAAKATEKGAKVAGKETAEVAKEVGKGTEKGAKAVAEGTKEVGKDAAHGTVKGAKAVGKVVEKPFEKKK
jgi:hypothetical protein